MDKEPEEMQHLGVVGVITEAFKLMRSYGRLLASLTTTLVLPLCFVVLAHFLITDRLADKMRKQADTLHREEGTAAGAKLERHLDSEMLGFIVFFVGYVIVALAISLLAFAAIVYSVACIYTGKGVSYSKVLCVVPRVWKRLMVTFLWSYLIVFAYELVFFILITLLAFSINFLGFVAILLILILTLAYIAVVVWLKMIWEMASVVTVLEEDYGLAAVRKSLYLLRGKRLVSSALQIIYLFPHGIIVLLFQDQVVHSSASVWWRIFIAGILISIFSGLWLMSVIVQSILYLVCKAEHHQMIDRALLSDHLDGFLGEYMPLKDPIPLDMLEP